MRWVADAPSCGQSNKNMYKNKAALSCKRQQKVKYINKLASVRNKHSLQRGCALLVEYCACSHTRRPRLCIILNIAGAAVDNKDMRSLGYVPQVNPHFLGSIFN